MAKTIFDPNTVAHSAEVNGNFSGTWDGTFMNTGSIIARHLAGGAVGFAALDNSVLPIGTVLQLFGNEADVPAGGNWVIMKGQTISDGASIYNNVKLPDMRGTFAMGGEGSLRTSPQAGGTNSNDHQHLGPYHQHNFNHNHDDVVTAGQNAYYSGAAASILTQSTSFTPPSHYHYVQTPVRYQDTDFRQGETGGVLRSLSGNVTADNRPQFQTFLFILRIK